MKYIKIYLLSITILLAGLLFLVNACSTYAEPAPTNTNTTETNADDSGPAIYGTLTNHTSAVHIWKVLATSLSNSSNYISEVSANAFRLRVATNDAYYVIAFFDLDGDDIKDSDEYSTELLEGGATNILFGTNSISNVYINIALPGQEPYTNGTYYTLSGEYWFTNPAGDISDKTNDFLACVSNSTGLHYADVSQGLNHTNSYTFYLLSNTYTEFFFVDDNPKNSVFASEETNILATNNLMVSNDINNLNFVFFK